jgi:hypothetical protein
MSDDDNDAPVQDSASATTLAQMTVVQIEETVGVLTEALSHDQMLKWLMLAAVLTQRSKQIKQRVDETAIAWIKGHGPITCGPIVYTVGQTKQVKCTDVLKCMHLLLNACGGDMDAVAAYFAANPYKHGSCHDLLPDDQWRSVFREDWQDKVVLKSTDTRFVPRARRGSAAS